MSDAQWAATLAAQDLTEAALRRGSGWKTRRARREAPLYAAWLADQRAHARITAQ